MTEKGYARPVDDAFKAAVAQFGDRNALIDEEGNLTYKEMDRLVTQQATHLKHLSIWHDRIMVALDIPLSRHSILLIYAVFRAGGTVVFVPRKCPVQRLENMLSQTNTELLITDKQYPFDIEQLQLDTLLSSKISKAFKKEKGASLEDIAYVIFTSGSTGEPKGVYVNQVSIVHKAYVFNKGLHELKVDLTYDDILNDLKPRKRVAVLSDLGFDVAILQIMSTLLFGHCLIPIPEDIKLSPIDLGRYFDQFDVNCCDITPTHLQHYFSFFQQHNQQVIMPDIWVSVGEKLSRVLLSQIYDLSQNKFQKVLNAYGPTEVTVYSNIKMYHGKTDEEITVGPAFENIEVYVLDENKQLVEKGTPGEVYIAGQYLARGYYNKPDITHQSFLSLPHITAFPIYKTNDWGYLLDNNELVIKGRCDNQIKISGYRIEIGEIEHVLNTQLIDISARVVLHEDEARNKKLVVFYKGAVLNVKETKEILKDYLLTPMIPNHYCHVTAFPLNHNGKLDKNILFDQWKGTTQRKDDSLISICEDILCKENIKADDNLTELGMTSLDLFVLTTRIYSKWGVILRQNQINECPTIDFLNKLIEKSDVEIEIDKNTTGIIPCSPLLKKLIRDEITDRKSEDQHTLPINNVVFEIPLDEYIDSERIESAVKALVNRYRLLQSSFEYDNDELFLKQKHVSKKPFNYMIVPSFKDPEIYRSVRDFQYDEAPLVQVLLIETSKKEQKLIINSHHGVSDQISTQIFLYELLSLYHNLELSEVTMDYFDYYQTLLNYDSSRNKMFWMQYISNRPKPLNFMSQSKPVRRRVSKNEVYGQSTFDINRNLLSKLKDKINQLNVSMFTVLSTIIADLLGKEHHSEDVMLGSFFHGRSDDILGSSQVLGMFAQILPIRFEFNANENIADLMKRSHANIESVKKHQLYDINEIYSLQTFEERINGPLFSVIINYNKTYEIKLPEIKQTYSMYEIGRLPKGVPCYFVINEFNDVFSITIQYAKSMYSKGDIVSIQDNIIQSVYRLIESC